MRETNWVRRERPGDRENKLSSGSGAESPAETPEEIAERVALDYAKATNAFYADTCLIDLILDAVRNERERAAKIAETHCTADCDGPDCGVVIARAIREGK